MSALKEPSDAEVGGGAYSKKERDGDRSDTPRYL
jgi:hypothetical protein